MHSRWLLPEAADPAAVAVLCRELNLPPLLCRLLVARGHRDVESAKRFLRPRLDQLHDPSTFAVLNPRKPGCPSLDKDLCAAGVAYKLAMAVTRAMGASPNPVYNMIDLVALATIADVAPLRGENRILAWCGLRVFNETKNA